MADGTVEVKITGSVDPSLTASAQEAKSAMADIGTSGAVSAKAMAAALTAAGGNLKAITPEMLGLAAATKATAAASTEKAAAEAVDTAATEVNTAATINNRAVYESLVLVHEALQGRYSRMAGSSLILTQQLAGQAAIANVVSFAMSGMGATILGTVAVLGAAAIAAIKYEEAQKQLTTTAIGLGAAAGLSAEQLDQAGRAAANWASQSISETTKAAEAFADAGVKSQTEIEQLAGSVRTYADLTGVKFAEAQKKLAEAMQDPIKGAEELHKQLGILDGDQIQQIQRLTELGQKDQAVAILVAAYIQRMREANEVGIGSEGILGRVANAFSNLAGAVGRATAELISYGYIFGDITGRTPEAAENERRLTDAKIKHVQAQVALNNASAKGAALYKDTPEGKAAEDQAKLAGDIKTVSAALEADRKLYGDHSTAVQRDRQMLEEYTRASNTYLTAVQKKVKEDALDVKIAEAKHAHNKQLVADLTEQKALLQEAGKVESDNDARALAKGKGDVAGARTGAGKGKHGPDIVSEWTEQLHQMEVASNDFFGDQTEKELQFWQAKLAQTKKGSKDWLDVQSKIYDAEKTLAHQAYDQHLADLNEKLEADKDNWNKEKADWDEKLKYIADHYSKESTEYKNAYREWEGAEREHQTQLLQIQKDSDNKQIEALKSKLAAAQALRNEYAKTAETLAKETANGEVLGEVNAAKQIEAIHAGLAEQEIADLDTTYQKQDALRAQEIAAEVAAGKQETDAYKNMLADRIKADQDYYAKRKLLEAQATNQQINDIIAVKNAYAGYISGTVNAAVTGLDGMLSRTENWKQALIGVYVSLVQTFEQQLEKMVTNWIVTHVFMTAEERAQLAAQNAAHAASEATKTAATTTGVATRAGVENTGFFTKILSLLGISTGHHVAAEATKTAATTTGVTTRAAVEDTTAATSMAEQMANNALLSLSYAAVAGAAGTASFAGAPWPIDMGAPAFGASMYADASSYAALAQLATGTNELPRDMIAQVHEGERIIPKADNTRLIQMMSMASGGINGGGRPDVHLHYAPNIHERERVDLKQLLSSGGGHMIAFIHQAVRDGKLKLAA